MNLMEKTIVGDVEKGNWTSSRNYFRVPILKDDLKDRQDGPK